MKSIKTIMVVLFASCTLLASAQEAERKVERPTNKDGKEILPEKGDIAIGVQAGSLLAAGGIVFGQQNTGNARFQSLNNTIYVKKFLDNNTAVRASFQLQKSGNTRVYGDTRDDNAQTDPLNTAQVTDKIKTASYTNGIGVGLEKRRGYGRLQGFYGGGLGLSFYNTVSEYTYGNEMSNSNPRPSTFGTGTSTTRTLKSVDNSSSVGANLFVGVEYFVARKISIQGEIGWGMNYSFNPSSETLYETMLNGERTEYTRNNGNDATKSFNYQNNGSSQLGVLFHF